MEYTAFKEALFKNAEAFGFTDCELYYAASDSFTVKIFGGEISEYSNSDAVGASFRGTFNGRVGYAYTERIDESVIEGLVKNAAENAGIIEEEEIEKLYPGDSAYPETANYNPALESFDAARKIETALAMEKFAYGIDKRVASIDYCVLSTDAGVVRIANSYGLDLTDRANIAVAFIVARVEENGRTKTGYDDWHGNDLNNFSYEELARGAVGKALSYLSAESAASGEYPIVFDNRAACELFACFSGIFFAENAQKGFSLLDGKEGAAVAAEGVTIRDDGVCKKSFGSASFDSEGVATQNKAVVENGVLKTLLYNTKSAGKAGVKSTGNGFKPSFRAAVGTACTNFYLKPSKISHKKMLAGIENGILITELAGLHSGANTISGDFSFAADGFLIENGKKGRAVEQITVAGNFYELLLNISTVASDLRFAVPSGAGTFGMPSFLVSGLRVSGL
ncbi:MAG: TldD/PmbA family protein [Clostridiales bacterium]|jgi:PmbA protein|nr:TldD/PmbA family protein [Clostridiales bacterium]